MEDVRIRKAQYSRALDGDTYEFLVDLGFDVRARIVVRLQGLDTPERNEPGWAEARATADAILSSAKTLHVTAIGWHRSFIRWIADVDVDGRSMAELMVAHGKPRKFSMHELEIRRD